MEAGSPTQTDVGACGQSVKSIPLFPQKLLHSFAKDPGRKWANRALEKYPAAPRRA